MRTIHERAALPGYMADFREPIELHRALEYIEVLCEMLGRYPRRATFIRYINLLISRPEEREFDDNTKFWYDSWERTRARWKRFFECFPQLPACTSLDLYASVDLVLYLWLSKLPNITSLSYLNGNDDQVPEMMVKPIASSLPSRLQKLELTVYTDHHYDMLDGFLSASAWSLQHLKLDGMHYDESSRQKIKAVLARHEVFATRGLFARRSAKSGR